MSTNFEAITDQALQLPTEERSALADRLWMSVHTQEDIDEAWDIEIRRRIAQIDAGEVEFVPWETVLARLQDQLKRAR